MIGLLVTPFLQQQQQSNNFHNSHHESLFPKRRLPVASFRIYEHENSEYSGSSDAHRAALHDDDGRRCRQHHDHGLSVLATIMLTIMMMASTPPTTRAFTPLPLTTAPHHRRRHGLFSTRDSVFVPLTDESRRNLEPFLPFLDQDDGSNVLLSTEPPQFQQQQQVSLFSIPSTQVQQQEQQPLAFLAATWLFAPAILAFLAIPSGTATAATTLASPFSLLQQAVDNLAYAILPESTPDLLSVVVGEGMGYFTYFMFTAAAISSLFAANQHHHQQQIHESGAMVVERDVENVDNVGVGAFFPNELDDDDHNLVLTMFSPVDGGHEEDALVPCAFVVEQALPAPPSSSSDMSQHQSLLHDLDWVEVFFDVTKWLSYFVLQQSNIADTILPLDGLDTTTTFLLHSAMYGFVAGFGAKFYADVLYRHLQQGPPQKRSEMTQQDWPVLCTMEATSAASLFCVYEAVQAPASDLCQWVTHECMSYMMTMLPSLHQVVM